MSYRRVIGLVVLLCVAKVTLGQTATAPSLPGPAGERAGRGSIAVVKDDLPANPAAASPDALADALRDAGYGVRFLRIGDLIDPEVLNRRDVDVLVLPNGVYYPAKGKAALVAYLQAGGSFLSAGGYAFDVPVVRTGQGWVPIDSESLSAGQRKERDSVRINTRFGTVGDIMWTQPDQLGVFDPSYLLTKVTHAASAPSQHVFEETFRIGGTLEGFAATAMTGNNQPVFPDVYARWIPLVNAYDRYGRLRGAAGALVHHYAGPFAGSSWAFFGVTNRDLLSEIALADRGLVNIIDALVAKTFLHDLKTDWASYRSGETVRISVELANLGRRPRDLTVSFFLGDKKLGDESVMVSAGESRTIQSAWPVPADAPDELHSVKALLREGERVIDEMEVGFVVQRAGTLAKGPRITFQENYFRIDDRPAFLNGTNQTGMMWYCATENPLVWDRDFAKMRDHGLRLLRILHFSPFASVGYQGKRGDDPLLLKTPPPDRLVRQTDAIVQLAGRHGIVVFLTLHDWMRVELTDQELAAQHEWNRWWAAHYQEVPGIIYDVQNEPSVVLKGAPHLKGLFNDFLRDRYGTTPRLHEAWGDHAPPAELGDVELPAPGGAWDDVRALDVNRFRAWLLDRWVRENTAGIEAGDAHAIHTVGYLPSMPPADKILGTHHVRFSNMHWYGPLAGFPLEFKLIDRRFENKSFSLGEFGAQEAHDARVRGLPYDHDAVSVDRYLATVHYALGLGASFTADWCWKDFNDCVFPWGAIHSQDGVPKPKLLTFRAMSLLFNRFEPRYVPPALYLLVPDSHRLGANAKEVHTAIRNSIRMLLECHANFNVINEYDLDRLPQTAGAIVYPVPYCPGDETFERVLRFVEAGGALCFSGDIAYDEYRRRTRADRYAKLNLRDPGERAPMLAPDAAVHLVTSQVGAGKVMFIPEPIEVRASASDRAAYRQFMAAAGVEPPGMSPDDPEVHAFQIATTDGQVWVLFNTSTSQRKTVEIACGARPIRLVLAPHKPGLAWLNGAGELVAVESSGSVQVGDSPLIEGEAHLMAASLDDRPLGDSRQWLILPLETGHCDVHAGIRFKEPVVAVGQIERGGWRELEVWRPHREQVGFRLDVTPDRSLGILVLAESDQLAGAVGRIVGPDRR